jgi:hypothetical protein
LKRRLSGETSVLIRQFVTARLTARLAVQKAVRAQANIDLRLAEDAVLLALAACFALFALHANNATGSGFGGHGFSVERGRGAWNITEVMGIQQRATNLGL